MELWSLFSPVRVSFLPMEDFPSHLPDPGVKWPSIFRTTPCDRTPMVRSHQEEAITRIRNMRGTGGRESTMRKKRRKVPDYSGLLISLVLETITPSFLWGFLMMPSAAFSSSRASSHRTAAQRIIS